MTRLVDRTGRRYGKLLVLGRQENLGRATRWLCQCDCGNTKVVCGNNLQSGTTKSCGCFRDERLKTHGLSKSRIYQTWLSMFYRTKHGKKKCYEHVRVDEAWNEFQPFADWALANGYADTLTLDRIDNAKGYSPSNCRFISLAQQQKNKTNNRPITIDGVTKLFSEWADQYGVGRPTLHTRLKKGMPIKQALGLEPRKQS